jgi:DNA-directed RNA polymerase specialized sigma24 family protein
MTDIDRAYAGTRAGDEESFTAWVRMVEVPLRVSLRRFAPVVDVEAIAQDALVRMWRIAPRLKLSGADASLHYARHLARNLAISEARRLGTLRKVDIEDLDREPEGTVPPAPLPDPRLRSAIIGCIAQLPESPRRALLERIHRGGVEPDHDLAARANMQLNTFLQNIVRARKFVAACLEKAGVPLKELLS